jgi:peroxiredoxin
VLAVVAVSTARRDDDHGRDGPRDPQAPYEAYDEGVVDPGHRTALTAAGKPGKRANESHGRLRRKAVRETRSARTLNGAVGGSTMAINVGDKLPKGLRLREITAEGMKDVDLDDITRGKTIVLFAVPGAFTPTCSLKHLPGFVDHAAEIRAKGIDEILCVSVNDAFVMDAWGKDQGVGGKVRMIADGNGDFTEALGLVADASGYGMGKRSKRYAMVVKDGTVQHLLVEPKGGLDVSSAESVLRQLG